MSYDAYDSQDTEQDVRHHLVRMVGGAAAVTKVIGKGIAVARTAAGRYTLTWTDNPGTFLGYSFGLQSTTINALRGCTVTVGVFNTTAFTLEVDVWDFLAQLAGVTVARDLAALEWLSLDLVFKLTGP